MPDHVLWIDNDPTLLRPFVERLRELGWTVTLATTATESIPLVQNGRFSVVLLDVMMPLTEEDGLCGFSPEETLNGGMTGLALYRRVRNHLEERGIPVIVLTIRADQGLRDEFLAAGLPPDRLVQKFRVSDTEELVALLCSVTAASQRGA